MYKSKILKVLIPFLIFGIIISFSLISCKEAAAPAEEVEVSEEVAPAEEVEAAEEVEVSEEAEAKITIWWWGEQEAPGAQAWMHESFELFQKDYPNVTFEEILQTTEGLVPAIQTAIETQSGPDIMTPWPGFDVVRNYESFYPMKEYVSQEVVNNTLVTDLVSYQGDAYGLPLYYIVNVFVYNKELFKQAGVENWDNFKPETWQDIMDACAKLKAANITPMTFGFKDLFAADWLYGGFGLQWATEQDVLAVLEGKIKYTEPKMYKFLEPFEDLAKNDYLNDDLLSVDLYQGGIENFVNEKAAMTFIPDTLIAGNADQVGLDKLGAFLLPVIGDSIYKDYVNISCAGCWVIPRWTPHPDIAGKFIEFVRSPERLEAFYNQTAQFPGDGSFIPETFQDSITELRWKGFREGQKYGPYLSVFWPWEIQELGTYVAPIKVCSGELTPLEAAELVQEQVDKYIELNPDVTIWKNWIEPLVDYYK